jgi:NitT/TauT family transport system permease protein
MIAVIMVYDQLMFRPLVAWADKFRFEQTSAQSAPSSSFLDLLQRSRLFRTLTSPGSMMLRALARQRFAPLRGVVSRARPSGSTIVDLLVHRVVAAAPLRREDSTLAAGVGWDDVLEALTLAYHADPRGRALILVASLIWVPIGVRSA